MRLVRWGGMLALVGVAHALGGPALIDHGVAGALLAGGGGAGTVAAAALLLGARLLLVAAAATLPVVVLSRAYGSAISKIRGGLGSPSK